MTGFLINRLLAYSPTLLLLAAAVTVAQEPFLELQPSTLAKPVNDNAYVSCSAQVPDTELVEEMEWIDPQGRKIDSMDDGSRIKTVSLGVKGTLELLIVNLKQNDRGVYKCRATYAGNVKLEKEIEIKIYKPIDFGTTPRIQTFAINSEAKVKCLVTAFPPPHVDWLKNGEQISSGNGLVVQQDGILISNIDESAEGIYRCRARVSDYGLMDFLNIQVEVHIPPEITGPPQDVEGVEKEAVNFQCVATGKPAPTYSWVDKDSRVLKDLEGYHVDDVTGQLTIMDVRPEQSGEYRCTASNAAGDVEATAHLRVLTKPKIEQFLNVTGDINKKNELRCITSGDPLPDIVFKKESNPDPFDNVNEDGRIEVIHRDVDGRREGILKINELLRKDDGLYTCTAVSDGGTTEGWGHITAQFPPTFEEQTLVDFWSWETEAVNLTCLATSIPNATIQWYMANKEIPKDDPNLVVKSLGPNGVLQVNPINPTYFAVYTCQASNILGTEELDVTLKQAHRPGPISSSQVKKKTATTIEWGIMDPTSDGGRPIIGYLVEYKLADQTWDESKNVFWTRGGQYIIDNLKAVKTYTFRFAARNEVGDSEWGGEKTEEMPEETVPEEPLIYSLQPDIVNPSPYSSHFELMWKVPLDNGKAITSFEIIYYTVSKKDDKWDRKGERNSAVVDYPGPTTYKIEGLRSESIYKIELRARNDLGASRPAEALFETASDPSTGTGTTSGGSTSVQYTSVASIISVPPHGPDAEPQRGLGVGIIIAIIIISILIIAGLIDVSCFFAKNAGVTATIVGKVGDSQLAKDKEAMLEDGINTRDDNIKQEAKEGIISQVEKPPLEKEPLPSSDTNVTLKSEKETEKHEGNGNMKADEEKVPLTQDEEKPKEATEPTETTPMIEEEGKTSDKDAIMSEEKQNLESGGNVNEAEEKTKDSPV